MPSTYTTNIGIEKPANGEQDGTWGTTVVLNYDIIDQAIGGIATVTLPATGSTGTPNDVDIINGTLSDGRNIFLEFDDGGDLGGSAYVRLTPNDAEKLLYVRNSLSGSQSIFLFQGTYNAANDIEITAGQDVFVKFDGAGTGATVTLVQANPVVTSITINGVNVTTVQPLDAGLTSIAGLTTAADRMIYTTGSDTYAVATLTSAGRALLDDADASAQRATLGVDAAGAVNGQPLDAGLTSISGLTTAADRMIYTTGSDTYAVATLTSAGRALLDDADASAQRTTLGLGTIATAAAPSGTVVGTSDSQTLTNKTLGAVTLSGEVSGADQTLTRVNLKDYGEITNAIGSAGGGTQDFDLTLGNSISVTIDTSTTTLTYSNPTASDELCGFVCTMTNGGSQTINYPAGQDWVAGAAPTWTASGVDVWVNITIDGGTTWLGFVVGLDVK